MRGLIFFLSTMLLSISYAMPAQPTEPSDPGSGVYISSFRKENFKVSGRDVTVFLPDRSSSPAAVIVFGHGQAIKLDSYEESFVHFARKGVAVIFPTYDSGFFDQDWHRMAKDYNDLTAAALQKFSGELDSTKVVYAGHSKGAYIALMAAGAPGSSVRPRSVVLFSPAGTDNEYLAGISPQVPFTVIFPDQDTIVKKALQTDIYDHAPSLKKQFIEVRSYPDLAADHFFVLTKGTMFGGHNGISAYQFYGFWKWLLGAAWDLNQGGNTTNNYLYGNEADSSGDNSIHHSIKRSW